NGDLRVAGSVTNVHGGTASVQAEGGTARVWPPATGNDGNTPGGFGFSYLVTDGSLSSSMPAAVVTITVSAVNDTPVAVNDSASTTEDTAVDINTLSLHDALPISNGDLRVAGSVTNVHGGTASVQA